MSSTVPVVEVAVTLLPELSHERRGSESGFEHSLAESAKRELWFAEQQLAAFAEHGLKPNDLQCIGFKTPVVFAESANVPNNAYVAELYEQTSFLEDLHRQLPTLLTAERSGSRSASHQPRAVIDEITITLKFRSSDDEPLSNLMDCEPLRSVVACDSQTITVREAQSHFSFRRTITSFDGLLK